MSICLLVTTCCLSFFVSLRLLEIVTINPVLTYDSVRQLQVAICAYAISRNLQKNLKKWRIAAPPWADKPSSSCARVGPEIHRGKDPSRILASCRDS